MEFADYPKHLRDKWKDIEDTFNRAVDRRGRRRQEAVNDVRDWMMSLLHGYEERNDKLKEDFECRFAKEMWKSEEWERAEVLEESLTAQENENYALRMAILKLEKKLSGVNLEKAPPEHF